MTAADPNVDILELLLEDHQDLRELFDELEDAEPQRRDEVFAYLVARLASHEAAEQAVVHSTVRDDAPGGDDVASARLDEEAEAERRLAEIASLDTSTDGFMRALRSLRDAVLAHAEHEEREEFPLLREHVGLARRQELGHTFQVLRQSGPTRPHPTTPQTPEVRAVAGPLVGMFDRARDAAREAFGS